MWLLHKLKGNVQKSNQMKTISIDRRRRHRRRYYCAIKWNGEREQKPHAKKSKSFKMSQILLLQKDVGEKKLFGFVMKPFLPITTAFYDDRR